MHMDVQPFLPTMRDAASPALLRVGWCHFVDVQEPEGLSSPEDCCTIASVLQAFEDDAHACNSPGGGALQPHHAPAGLSALVSHVRQRSDTLWPCACRVEVAIELDIGSRENAKSRCLFQMRK